MKQYIDMGVPSGILWAESNVNGYFEFEEAIERFGNELPTKEEFEELLDCCYHRWDKERKGIEFLSKNGNTLFFPAIGDSCSDGPNINFAGQYGHYWSSTPFFDNVYSYDLYFSDCETFVDACDCNYDYAIRLVKRK